MRWSLFKIVVEIHLHTAHLHEIIISEVIQSFTVCANIHSINIKKDGSDALSRKFETLRGAMAKEDGNTNLPTVLVPASAGLLAAFGFFFPLALSLCSFCFSLAKAVNALALFLTSTSLSG